MAEFCKVRPKLIIVLVLVCFWVQSFAQQKLVRSYSVKDGLAGNTVYRALVDKKGYLWFATDAGVSMFDGTNFTNFSANDGLADNDVFGLFEDGEERIWFLCFYKQPCFYYKGKIYNSGNFKELQKIKNYNWHVSFADEDEAWFIGKDHLYRFKDNKVSEYRMERTYKVALITKINADIYILKDTLFYLFDAKTGTFDQDTDLKLNVPLNDVLIDEGNGRIILSEPGHNGVTRLYSLTIDPVRHRIEKRYCCSYDKPSITSTIDKQNNLLRTTFLDNSVVERDLSSDSLKIISEYQLNSYVSYEAIDNQGNRWFTLLHGGVEMFPKIQSNRVTITAKSDTQPTFCSITKVNETIVAGNSNNTLFIIRNGNANETEREYDDPQNSRILDLKMDQHNRLWLGTDDDVITYDPGTKKFHALKILTSVKDIKYDSVNDMMLFASSNGCFTVSCREPGMAHYINNERTTCIAGSLSDTCWFETLNGLYVYDGRKSWPDSSLGNQFKSRVSCLETDRMGRLWVGTSSNGVFLVQRNGIIAHVTGADGLTSNICKNIFIDRHNEAWVSTNLGVSHLKYSEGKMNIVKYNDRNCLVDNDVNDVLVVGDTVFVASSTGIVFFDVRSVTDDYRFPLYISKIKVADSVIVAQDSFVNLATRQNTLTISFSGLSYLSNGNIDYEYYIPELSTRPFFTKNNSVTYSSLSPGTYNFYVKAVDVFGNRSIRPAHIRFTILPEWYQLLWLRWLAALSFVALCVFITFKYSQGNERRKRLKSELNQTISRLELEAIHLQINPHFIFNCLNAVQNAIHKNNAETASYFVNRFAKLMRKALMLSKESFITIEEEYSFIDNYLELERLRFNNNFDYLIEIDSMLNKNATFVPAFVLQTFIENSINHGIKYLKDERGLITLRFVKTDRLEIHLDDSGIGINASRIINHNSLGQHSSKGLELMRARVDSLNKLYHRNIQIKITDKSELNKDDHGTVVIISLDIS